MASVEGDVLEAAEEFSFLDLNDCSPDTKRYLLDLIEDESKPRKQPVQAAAPPPVVSSGPDLAILQQQQQQQQQMLQQQQHFENVYTPSSQPYVFINNMTANVNVHHGAAEQPPRMKQPPHAMPPPPNVSSTIFPPPPPNPLAQAFPNPPVVTAPGFMPNGAAFIPHGSHQFMYQHQLAAFAKAQPNPGTPPHSLYMSPVIYYPFPIPVTQPAPVAQPRPMRNSPPTSSQQQAPQMPLSTAAEIFYPQQQHLQVQPQHLLPPHISAHVANADSAIQIEPETQQQQHEQNSYQQHEEEISVEEQSSEVFDHEAEATAGEEMTEETEEVVAAEEEKIIAAKPTKKAYDEAQQKRKDAIMEEAKARAKHNNSGSASKSWASLFHKESASNAANSASNKPMARIQPYNNAEEGNHHGAGNADGKGKDDRLSGSGHRNKRHSCINNPNDLEMGNFLKAYALNHRSSMIKPRGLGNRSNWCFVNAVMQALVACPPFYNLIKSLPEDVMKKSSGVKIIKVIHEFVSEFSPLDHFPKLNRRDKGKKNEDLPLGTTFEAGSIFQFLLTLNTSDTFKVEEGRQEDGEEFLTFLLNQLNDEMLALIKLLDIDENDEDEEEKDTDENDEVFEQDGNEWHEVGARNRSLLTRRVGNSNETVRSPVGNIFQGQLQSCVQLTNGEPTATLQPFFTLPLDIQSKNIKNVSDALHLNFSAEALDGYVCSKTKKEIEASRSLYLDELPSVLILHLKRFIYDETSSAGCQKLLKNIDFPVDLEIPKEILSANSRNKYHPKQRSYKLFAVVYHNGKEASLGHYVTNVYHAGLGWLHCDDSLIKSMTESMVLTHSAANSVPYILFYRRGDTVGSGQNAATSSTSK